MATNAVKIKTNAQGAFVNVYQSNPEFGYIVLESNEISFKGGFVNESKRTTLIRGSVNTLEAVVGMNKAGLPGKIAVREYLEDFIPADVAKTHLRDDVSFEEAIKPYIKRAGEDGVILTKDGKRILRFTEYDPANVMQDIIVAHDNIAEVMASKSAGSAQLPNGDEKAPF